MEKGFRDSWTEKLKGGHLRVFENRGLNNSTSLKVYDRSRSRFSKQYRALDRINFLEEFFRDSPA